jgi:superfamily I DNA/RNA helicase
MALLRRHVKPDEWKPAGIDALEDNALDVVRSTNNRFVIAGPGSGKTELLAQRASFLLQCGVSPPPQRILAISYKRDAAFNIAKRVSARCHPEQAHLPPSSRSFRMRTSSSLRRHLWGRTPHWRGSGPILQPRLPE